VRGLAGERALVRLAVRAPVDVGRELVEAAAQRVAAADAGPSLHRRVPLGDALLLVEREDAVGDRRDERRGELALVRRGRVRARELLARRDHLRDEPLGVERGGAYDDEDADAGGDEHREAERHLREPEVRPGGRRRRHQQLPADQGRHRDREDGQVSAGQVGETTHEQRDCAGRIRGSAGAVAPALPHTDGSLSKRYRPPVPAA